MELFKRPEMTVSEWERESSKAEWEMKKFLKKIPCESAQEEFHNRCLRRFQELIQEKVWYPSSFYTTCFHRIFVDMCRKNQLYLHTYSKPSDSHEFLSEQTSPIYPKLGISKTEMIKEAISLLTPYEKRLVHMMDYCKMTSAQVASILGKDQSTYHRQHKKILEKMKEGIIERWGGEIWNV